MAQLKDSIVAGNLRVTNTTFSDTVQVTKIKAPTTAGGTSYDVGTSGQFIRSNGTSSYWGGLAATDIPALNYVPNTQAGLSAAINLLGEGTSNPQLGDYYVAQYAGGGTTTTSYHRRPVSALWNTFKGLITAETTGSGNAITEASIANDGNNRKITFTKGTTFSTTDEKVNITLASTADTSYYFGLTNTFGTNKLNYLAGTYVYYTAGTVDSEGHQAILPINTLTLGMGHYDYMEEGNIYLYGYRQTGILLKPATDGTIRTSYTLTLPMKNGTVCLTNHTHNYAGSSSAGGAATSANKLNTNDGSATKPVYFSGGVPVAVTQPASGAWFSAVPTIDSSGVLEIGRYIDFHATAASTNSYDIRLDASSTSLITLSSSSGTAALRIAGTLPRLRFQQTTSGREYDNGNCGITAYAGVDIYGVDMTIQSGDRMIIGGGEYPTNFFTLADKEYYDQWSLPESCYIGADNVVVVHTNMSTPAQRKSFIFTGGGNFAIPESGGLYFSTKVASDATAGVYHKLLHAAGTDSTVSGFAARTWTLPDKSGNIATTNRGGTLYFTSYGNTHWGKVLSIVINTADRMAWGMFTVSQAAGSQASGNKKGAGILQISCVTNSSGVNTTDTRAMWLVAGGNIAKANFKLIAKNNTPATGSTTFELWIKNTATYHIWAIAPMVCTDSIISYTLGDGFTYYDARNANATTTTPTGDFVHTSEFFTPVTS